MHAEARGIRQENQIVPGYRETRARPNHGVPSRHALSRALGHVAHLLKVNPNCRNKTSMKTLKYVSFL